MPSTKRKAYKHQTFNNPLFLEREGYSLDGVDDGKTTNNNIDNQKTHGAKVTKTEVNENKKRFASIYDKGDYLDVLTKLLNDIMPTIKSLKKFKKKNKSATRFILFGGRNVKTGEVNKPIMNHYFLKNNSISLKDTEFKIQSLPYDCIDIENQVVSYEYIYNYLLATFNSIIGKPIEELNKVDQELLVYSLESL